jgi:uncharacterized repeat protein (TIGR01451 family)
MRTSRSGLSNRQRRFRLLWGTVVVAAAACGILFVAASGATLAPSTFEGNDGNMTVDTAGHTDWVSLAGNPQLRTLVDLPSGSGDNAFGQGTKEDSTSVTVVTGSIPPNKNDLTRAYVYNDRIGGSSFIYLAWERAAAIGDAHIDFELNQNATQGFDGSTTGQVTLNRTVGDLLLAYDFGGSGTPTITLFTWDGSAWSNQQDLSALGFAEAAVNTADLSDVLDNNATVGAGEFGEASVNLSDALLAAGFNQDTCQSFGSIMVKARSSGSSTSAELKDFIAPVPFHASNCATPTIATQTSVASLTVGATQTVGDTATLTGDNPSGDVSFQLYSDASCADPVAGVSGTATLDGSGVAALSGASFTPDHAGTYYWGVNYPGDNHNNAASACGGANEEIVVNKASPSVSTIQQPASGAIGDTFKDTATLSGAVNPDGTGSITFKLYSASDCDSTVLDTETVDGISTNGSYSTPTGFQLENAGTYYWVASFSGDSNNNAFTSGCNDEPMVVVPNSPSISTKLSKSAGSDGVTVHDSAALADETEDAGGTVTYSVFSDIGCTNKVADGGTVPVTDGTVPDSNNVTFENPGTYYWQAKYSGDANNKAAVSPCSDEQLVVSPLVDLAVTKVGFPNPDEVGSNITWTMVVTNNGPDTATGVTISDPMPTGNTYVSASTTHGSCTGGAILSCSLGTIPAKGTVTITLVTTPTVVGTVTNTVMVVGNETETDTSNNTASASVVVNEFSSPPPPPVFCVAVSRVTPKQLFVGRKTTLTIRVTQGARAVRGIHVRIKGPKINVRTKASNGKGVIKHVVKMKKAGVVVFTPIASRRCNTKRVGVTGVFTPPVTG